MARVILDKNISEVENKIPNTSSLVTTIVLNTKINQVAILMMPNILLLKNVIS